MWLADIQTAETQNNRRTSSVRRKIQFETLLNLIATILSSIILLLLTGWLKAILEMRRISSWRPLSHVFLSQGKSCSKTSVWMCYGDGNHGAVKSLLSWLLGLCPTSATSSITAQWQCGSEHSSYPEPANQWWRGAPGPCQNAAHSPVLSGHSKSQRRPLCLGWDLFRRCSDGGRVCLSAHLGVLCICESF